MRRPVPSPEYPIPTCDLTPLEIGNCQADARTLIYNYQVLLPAMRNYTKDTTNFIRHTLSGSGAEELNHPSAPVFENIPAARPPGSLNRIINTIGRIKLSAGFNDIIAADLQLISAVANILSFPRSAWECPAVAPATINRDKCLLNNDQARWRTDRFFPEGYPP